ncbi:MAG: Gfo/Idh/MocA family oxidoreductase [Candidatus Nezhaarchaeota archaeon]|nr:Gfo/Idh/MocA family oxidoreductase [Candidatus Nezhaarchaeota archaeon]
MTTRKLRVGIVGCGSVAGHHVDAWRKNRAEVVAVCDVVEEKARGFALNHGVGSYFKSVDDMLENTKLDVVSICTPPQTHKQIALSCVGRGVNAFVEKPLALSYHDALELVKEAEARGVKLWATMNFLFTPTMKEARRMLNSGLIGRLRRVDAIVYAPQEVILRGGEGQLSKLPGGAFGEVPPHPIYLTQSILGRLELISKEFKKLSNSA